MPCSSRLPRVSVNLALCAALAAGGGCASLGPAAIANGRAAYTDVITRTNDEQLLGTLVRLRYAETTSMLMVTAITAQSELRVGSGIQAGTGPQKNYDGNLVPFSLDGSYSETPTISYEPITGEKYLRRLITPISLDLYGLLVDGSRDAEWMLQILTGGIAGLDSPVHYESPRAADLSKALALMARLRRAGALTFAFRTGDDESVVGVNLLLDNYADGSAEQVSELMALLHKPMPEQAGAPVNLPLQMGRLSSSPEALRLQTRSTLELMQLASSGVEVPESQLAAGIAPPATAASAQPFLVVHSSIEEPEDPFVSVPYRGHWFWIASNDIPSKRGFVAMQMLLQSCLHDEGGLRPQLSLPIN